MSKVDWDLEKCEANTKAKIDGDTEDLAGIVGKVASLKLDQSVSSIAFNVPYSRCRVRLMKNVIDSLAELLKANPNIKSLQVGSTDRHSFHARQYLLEVLADGIAGDSLEYLWLDDLSGKVSAEEIASLARHLTRNHNLTQLRFDVTGASSCQLFSCLPASLKSLRLDVSQYRCGMAELGATLGRCSSLLSLNLNLANGDHLTPGVESFFRGIGPLRSLTYLGIGFHFNISAEVIDALLNFIVQQQGTLAHFAIETAYWYYTHGASFIETWNGLGLALCSVKSVSLSINTRPQDALLAVLPQLQACQSLELLQNTYMSRREIRPILEVASRLPNLRDLTVDAFHFTDIRHAILDMIKSSNSIHAVHLKRRTVSAAFQGGMESFCILNRVFGTNLVGFRPTDLWTHVLSKVSDESARATLLYRLLREKPEMVLGSITQPVLSCNY